MEIYGFAMLDLGYNIGKVGDPLWFDVLRPTKLPAFNGEFGNGSQLFAGVRQSRLGVKTSTPTRYGDLKTTFEIEMFGVGVDAGQTTIRLRHAYGVWHNLRAGQTWSPFMDPDVFPDSIEYWGPPGMVFFRNVQLAYSFFQDDYSDATIALERPGASADTTQLGDRFDLTGVTPQFPVPDISGDIKVGGPWGHLKVAGIMRYMAWEDLTPTTPIIQGHAWGWGVTASTNLRLGSLLFKIQGVYGKGIENYMNDAGHDVAPKLDPTSAAVESVEGVALPVIGATGFVDVKWNDLLTSTGGYSFVWIQNSDGQAPDAFRMGQYALGNVLIHPVKSLLFGPEFQWGRRANHSDGFSVNDYRIQFSVKYNFSHTLGGS
jgi:hypothetical protein